MDIALLNTKVMFQKQTVDADEYGNHVNTWTDYYKCNATISGEGGSETEAAGETVDNAEMAVTVRYCRKAASVNVTGYRIVLNDELYDILAVDHLSNKKKALKFRCRKVRR